VGDLMRPVLLAAALTWSAAALADGPEPSNQALVFYNARIALRENRSADVLKLWLLRNSLHQRGEHGEYDGDFRSVVWAALGNLGYCQDGIDDDHEDGAGLWPLALHNYVVRTMGRGPPTPQPAPFDAFQVGRQQRFVSLHDVLNAEELRSVSFFRGHCRLPRTTLARMGSPFADLDDRLVTGQLLRHLLRQARATLVRDKVQNLAAIDARLFDLDLVLAEMQARRARAEAREAAQHARSVGVSRQGAADLREQIARGWPRGSKQAEFLRSTLDWSVDEWLSLSRERRLFLFSQARALSEDPARLEALVLGIVDALAEQRQGGELEAWIGWLDAQDDPARRLVVTGGERGRRLLELEPETGFRERAVVALHRGVAFLETGAREDALRSFAYAMQQASGSREPTATVSLARRWLAYVLARYEANEEVVAMLSALVPRTEYNAIVEELIWRAALRADARSFERLAASVRRGGSLDLRIEKLRPLSRGDAGAMATALRASQVEEPWAALRFVRGLVENLESEDGDVRRANVPTLKLLRDLLAPMTEASGQRGGHARIAEELLGRTQAILDGLDELDASVEGRARTLSVARETFAGSIRLAPADPLPWPFVAPQPEAPSAFVPIVLEPVEWWDAERERVFGWRITE
jgi:hypothetical protein